MIVECFKFTILKNAATLNQLLRVAGVINIEPKPKTEKQMRGKQEVKLESKIINITSISAQETVKSAFGLLLPQYPVYCMNKQQWYGQEKLLDLTNDSLCLTFLSL